MTDWSAALARAFQEHLEISGSCGSRGSEAETARDIRPLRSTDVRTTDRRATGSVVRARTIDTTPLPQVVQAGALQKAQSDQRLRDSRTSRTTGTTENTLARSEAREAQIVTWLDQNPAPSTAGRCCWCGHGGKEAPSVVPFGTVAGTHAWLHSECWPAWQRMRRDQALRALAAGDGP
jgi:hypothetical protein